MNSAYGYGYSPMQNPNYQVRLNNLQQQMQPTYPQYQQTYPQSQQMYQSPIVGIKGRPVTSIDEAKAAQIDLDGTLTYFPSIAENKIYVKSIGFDGLPVFNVYQLVDNQPTQPTYADNNTVIALQKRVEQLESLVKGVTSNVQSNADNATDGTTATKQ